MDKQVVIITGAAKGIGKGIAELYSSKGYIVVIADIDSEEGMAVSEKITLSGGEAVFFKTDVSCVDDIKHLMDAVFEKYERIDVLINNAGISEFFDPLDMEEAVWNRIIDTNLKGVFFASREAAKYMKIQGRGSIVNIASTRALMSEPNSEGYAASKGGIVALTHAMAASFSKYHITVNSILPGWIETGDYSSLRDVDHAQHFSGRVGKPEDIARACMFLTSPENDFITGSQIVVDGGMTRKMIYEE